MSQMQSFFISSYGESSQCEEMNLFLRSHKIIKLTQGFVSNSDNPGFHILIEYAENAKTDQNKNKRVDYRAMLEDDGQKKVFDAMRKFRAELCKKDKLVGAYMICKDEHLFEMAKNPSITLEEILAFPHSANIKLEEYGKILFDELAKIRAEEKIGNQKENEAGEIPF